MLTDVADRRKRFTIEVYPEEEHLLGLAQLEAKRQGKSVREFVIMLIEDNISPETRYFMKNMVKPREKLEKLDAAEKGKSKQ